MTLEHFVLTLSWDDLPDKTRRIVRLCVLDVLGCAVAGSRCDGLARHVAQLSRGDLSSGEPIWGTRLRAPLDRAIFFNAHTAAYFDMDDGHRRAQGHPGATIIPAALATAQHYKRSGRSFLEAVVVGYEVAVRSALVIRALGGPRKGSGGWAAIGTAAACARLMGCSAGEALNAIGLAEYYAPQAHQDRSAAFPSEVKEGIAWGAMTGYTAALLASGGFTAMRPMLADSPTLSDLGQTFEIDQTYFKNYASCRWAHPALDSVQTLLATAKKGWDSIVEIRIRTFEKALLMERNRPASALDAIYSIPYAVSAFLVRGALDPQQLSQESLNDPDIVALAQRIRLVSDPELTAQFPDKCLQQVDVDFNDGTRCQGPLTSAKGDPDRPYSETELTDKFHRLTAEILGPAGQRVPALVMNLEHETLSELLRSLIPA